MSVLRRAALSACGVAAVLSSGCAVAPAGPSVLVLPGPNATQARFQADQAACQQQAQAQVAPAVAAANNQAVATAAVGTAIGAAVGALVGYGSYGGYGGYGGYRHHYTNQSAAWGAGAGLMYGGAVGGSGSQAANLGLQQRYDNAFTFVYSSRPGTEAADLPDAVAHDVAVDRMQRLRAVVERTSRLGHVARIGHTEEVMVEGPSRRDPGRLSGRTRHNRLIHFPSEHPLRPGTYAQVLVTEASTTNLIGELVEVVAMPSHRRRIPVSLA